MFEIYLTDNAREELRLLRKDKSKEKRFKAVSKALKLLAQNPRHPGLETHGFTSLQGPSGEKVFEAYAEQATPAAYRVFWYYGSRRRQITVIAITPHP